VSDYNSIPAFIGVDWGTSKARFMLIASNGEVLDERTGPGIASLAGVDAIQAACCAGVGAWVLRHADIPILMCGMVGSNIGWRTAPYLMTPVGVDALARDPVRFEYQGRQLFIVPGVETMRLDGAPDLMRGEETQIFGALAEGKGLACLPGTHCKWATVSGGQITGFHTALTGELMALIGKHSILLNSRNAPHATASEAFTAGVQAIQSRPVGLETLLFTVRSLQIKGELSVASAADYLCGLCIGADVKSALTLYPHETAITLIGTPALTSLYRAALHMFGREAHVVNGNDAVVSGLTQIYMNSLVS